MALTWSLVPIGSFAAFGPAVAALAITAVTEGRAGLRAWTRRLLRWRVAPRWYAIALAVPLAVVSATVGLNVAFGAPVAALHKLDPWYSLVLLFAVRLIVPVLAPLVAPRSSWCARLRSRSSTPGSSTAPAAACS